MMSFRYFCFKINNKTISLEQRAKQLLLVFCFVFCFFANVSHCLFKFTQKSGLILKLVVSER